MRDLLGDLVIGALVESPAVWRLSRNRFTKEFRE
jgi:hypothetical protein